MKKLIPFLLIITFASCKINHNKQEETAAIEQKNYVKIERIESKTEPISIHAIGRLGSDTEVKLSFKIGGFISSIRAKEGDYIRKGTLLASMRTNEIDAQVMKAKRAFQKAQRDLKRIQKMYADAVATSENVDDLTTLYYVTKADLKVAKFNQKYARIVSPIRGRMVKRLAEPNELVSSGQPIFLIASASRNAYVMKVNLSDKDINRIEYGSTAILQFDAFSGEVFDGKVSSIAESADRLTGTFEVEIEVMAKGKRLRNGYIGTVEIQPLLSAPYLVIPIQSVVEGNKKEVTIFVPTQSDTIAKEIQVEPFHITNQSIYISKPEAENIEKVITVGASYLMDGDRIYVE